MTAKDDGDGRRTAEADLLASLPGDRPAGGVDPAAFEELRTAMVTIGEQLAGLREAVRAAPVTAEALTAWSDDLLKRFDAAARPAPDAVAGLGNHAGKVAAAAAKTEEAAERIDRALARLSAEVEGMGKSLAEDRSEIRTGTAGIESAAARIETNLGKLSDNAGWDSNWILNRLEDIEKHMARLRFGWRAFLAPWVVFVFVLGMALESRIHLLYRWLWAS